MGIETLFDLFEKAGLVTQLFGPIKGGKENFHQYHSEKPGNRPDHHTGKGVENPAVKVTGKTGKGPKDRHRPKGPQKKIDKGREGTGF
jgi:hypothetical protein